MAVRKKIALCLEYPLALRGGVSVLVETLLKGLSAHYDLVLVSPDSPKDLASLPAASLIKQHFHWNPALVSARTSATLANQLKETKVDLAHLHMGGNFGFGNRFPGQSPFSRLDKLGVPCCSSVHSVTSLLDGYCGPQKPLWFKLAMFPLAYLGKLHSLAHTRKEIAVSKQNLQRLRRWYFPLRSRYIWIYHSRLRENSRPISQPERERFILNVGHIAGRKGQVTLAKAFARIAPKYPDWKLYLVGHVAEEETGNEIKQVAASNQLADRLIFAGERNDISDWMSHAGIYVQPSYSEALGLALQEAMSCGCPSIGSCVGGIPELIDHQKNGFLVPPGNAEELAQALEKLITNADLRNQYGRAAAASIVEKGMTFEQMIANHVRLYESILEQK